MKRYLLLFCAVLSFFVAHGQQLDTLRATVFTASHVKTFANHKKYYLAAEDRNRFATALQALELVPNVRVLDGEVSLQGGRKILLVLNGIPARAIDLAAVPPSDIKSIDVYTDPPARYATDGRTVVVSVRTRGHQQGGALSLSSLNAFQTVFNKETASFQYNFGKSQIGIWYDGKINRNGGFFRDQTIGYTFDGVQYSKVKTGREGVSKVHRHGGMLDYAHFDEGRHAFRVRAGIGGNLVDNSASQQVLRSGVRTVRYDADLTDRNLDLSPWFDLYGEWTPGEKHNLAFNLTGEAYRTVSRYGYAETELSAGDRFRSGSRIDGRTQSIVGQVSWAWDFADKHAFEASARCALGRSFQECRTLAEDFDVRMRTVNTLLFAKVSGALAPKLFYSVRANVDGYSQVSATGKRVSPVALTAMASLHYLPGERSDFLLQYVSERLVPSLSDLNTASYFRDDKYAYSGNPDLVPYVRQQLSLQYSFTSPWIDLFPTAELTTAPGEILPSFVRKDAFILETKVNADRSMRAAGWLTLQLKPLRDKSLTVGATAQLGYDRNQFGSVTHAFWGHFWGMHVSYSRPKWSLTGHYNTARESLAGPHIVRGEHIGYLEGAYCIGEHLRLGLGIRYPFFKGWEWPQGTVQDAMIRLTDYQLITSFRNMVYATLVYRFSFGRKGREVQQRLTNEGAGSGALKR